MTTGHLFDPRALDGDPDHDGYVLTTVAGVPMWLPGGITGLTSADSSVTITDNGDGTLDLAAAGGGGGGGGGVGNDRRWNAAASETSIDEFNDDSLDAAWTRVDGTGAASGNATWTEEADVLSAGQLGGDTSAKLHGLVRPLTGAGGSLAVGDAFITCVTIQWPFVTYGVAGLVLSDNAAFGSGTQVWSILYGTSTANLTAATRSASGWTDATTDTAAVKVPAAPTFLRLVMTAANTWRTDVSPDGVTWVKGSSTRAVTVTPTHVGLVTTSYGTSTKAVHSYEFLRRVAGIT